MRVSPTARPDAGKPGGAVAGMELAELVKAWDTPFASRSLRLTAAIPVENPSDCSCELTRVRSSNSELSASGCPALPTGPIPPLPAGSTLAGLPGAEDRPPPPPRAGVQQSR